MKKLNKLSYFLSGVLCSSLVLSLAVPAFAEGDTSVNKEIVFTDVVPDAFYAEAVQWAVSNDITAGTSETTFSPDKTCTVAEALTFLYRAENGAEPVTWAAGLESYTEVSPDAWYYDASIWASVNAVGDLSPSTASSPCTRANMVRYLWRAYSGESYREFKYDYDMPFTDITNVDFPSTIGWAVENEITYGTSDTTFSPDKTCTRGEIVTFLYRAANLEK